MIVVPEEEEWKDIVICVLFGVSIWILGSLSWKFEGFMLTSCLVPACTRIKLTYEMSFTGYCLLSSKTL